MEVIIEKKSFIRYTYLPEHERITVDKVLRGHQFLDAMPNMPPRIVRIFLSSTFTGTFSRILKIEVLQNEIHTRP